MTLPESGNLGGLLADRAAEYGERTALVQQRRGQRRAITFAQLAERVERSVALLRARGLEPGDRVLVLVPPSIELYVTLLACFSAGTPALFVDAWADRRRLADAIRCARPKAVVGIPAAGFLQLVCGELGRIPIHITTRQLDGTTRGDSGPAALGSDHPALITLTTGTTGKPRAAARSHRFLWAQHRALAECLRLRPDDTDLTTFPIVVLNNLAIGISTVLPACNPRRPGASNPVTLFGQIAAEGVTTLSAAPASLQHLAGWCEATGHRLPLRAVHTGGAPVLPALGRLLGRTVAGESHAIYGSTEAEPIARIEIGEMLHLHDREGPEGLPAGHPVPGIRVRLIRAEDGPVALDDGGWAAWETPNGETGEVVVAGEHVLDGYLDNPEADRAGKIRDGKDVWHRTGDGARLDEAGRLWLMGRVSARVRSSDRAWWSIPAELRVSAVAPIAHAAYFGEPREGTGDTAVLCVEAPGGRLEPDQRLHLRESLRSYPVDRMEVLRHIPRDPRHASKTDLGALRRRIGAVAR